MAKDPATTAFVAFCRTGDPHLLGRVFDRLAPELLLVAARLLPPRGDAPDVVQQTFVTALQTRKRFDGERAVAPWLVGILLQHVRHERRRLRRCVDADRLGAPSALGPVDAAISVELAERVRQVVAALSQPYRQVLQLHLVHGLSTAEVAASLERPFRSVQSQLRRGLQKLRGALPKLAIAPCLPQLAAARANVLRAATAACTGWFVLPWLRVAALVASVSLPAALLVATAAMTATPPALAAATAVTAALAATEVTPAREAPEASPRRFLRHADPPCRVRITVVAAEDDTALPGALVTFTLDDPAAAEPGRRRVLEPATTDAQGAVQVEVPSGARHQLEIAIAAPGRLAVRRQFPVPGRDVWTIEGVALRRSVRGRVRVCDQHLAPVHGVMIVAGVPPVYGFSLRETPRARTDNDGWTDAIEWPSGDVLAALQRVPLEFACGDETQLPMSLRDGACTLTLSRPAPDTVLGGRVLDEQGHPVPDARVGLARASDGARLTRSVGLRSDRDGRFVVPVPVDEPGPFKIAANVGRGDTQLSEHPSSHWTRWLDLAVATTDARGLAELPWQPWEETVVIRADGPGHVRRELELPRVVPGGEPLEVRVARGATLRGTLAHVERWPELAVTAYGEKVATDFARLLCRVALRNAADGELETGPEGRSFAIAADGSFGCEDVPPGRWQVMFEWGQPQSGGGAVMQQIGWPLDEVVAIGGREHEVRLDLARVLPGALHGRILLDGEPAHAKGFGRGGWRIDHLGRVHRAGGYSWAGFVRPDGSYRMGGIPPGQVDLEATIDGKRYRLLEPVTVTPGADTQLDLHFRHLVARIRLKRADGTPVGPRLARLDGDIVEVDTGGWLTLDPLPTLRVQVELFAAGVTRNELYGMRFDDPRARTCTLSGIDIDPTLARSEHTLTVPDDR